MSQRNPQHRSTRSVLPRKANERRWRKLLSLALATMIGFPVAMGLSALPAAATPASSTTSDDFTVVKYGQTFIYHGSNEWTITNNDGSKAIKNLASPSGTRPELCTDYDTGLGLPCTNGASYDFVSTATFAGQSCAYVQIDGGANGSQDTVPGEAGKRVCAPEPPVEECVSVDEYQYSKTSTVYTVEHKEVQGWKYNGNNPTYVGGQKWYPVPDQLVNSAGVNPLNYKVGQTFHLRGVYNISDYAWYRISAIEVTDTVPSGALFYETLRNQTVYYLPGGDVSSSLTDANWTTDTPSSPWTLVDSRTLSAEADCTPTIPQWVDECGPDNGHWSYTNGSWYSFEVTNNQDGSVTIKAIPNTGQAFAPNTVVEWTETDSDEACPLPEDASASIGIVQPTCDTDGSAYVTGLVNAELVDELDTTVGKHTAQFIAFLGHLFDNGLTTLSIEYTVPGALGGCLDASASIVVSPPVCGVNGSASLGTLTFAKLDGELDTTPGDHTATFKALFDHLFGNGTDTLQVPYTVLGALLYQHTDSGGDCYVQPPEKEDDVEVQEGTWLCGDTEVRIATIVTKYTFDFDNTTGTFSEPIAHVENPVYTTRQLTDDESKQNCSPPEETCTDQAGNEHPKGDPACSLASTGASSDPRPLMGLCVAAILVGAMILGLSIKTRKRWTT